MTLEKGDFVELRVGCQWWYDDYDDESNPKYTVGIITHIHPRDDLAIEVAWLNGIINRYTEHDLILKNNISSVIKETLRMVHGYLVKTGQWVEIYHTSGELLASFKVISSMCKKTLDRYLVFNCNVDPLKLEYKVKVIR